MIATSRSTNSTTKLIQDPVPALSRATNLSVPTMTGRLSRSISISTVNQSTPVTPSMILSAYRGVRPASTPTSNSTLQPTVKTPLAGCGRGPKSTARRATRLAATQLDPRTISSAKASRRPTTRTTTKHQQHKTATHTVHSTPPTSTAPLSRSRKSSPFRSLNPSLRSHPSVSTRRNTSMNPNPSLSLPSAFMRRSTSMSRSQLLSHHSVSMKRNTSTTERAFATRAH